MNEGKRDEEDEENEDIDDGNEGVDGESEDTDDGSGDEGENVIGVENGENEVEDEVEEPEGVVNEAKVNEVKDSLKEDSHEENKDREGSETSEDDLTRVPRKEVQRISKNGHTAEAAGQKRKRSSHFTLCARCGKEYDGTKYLRKDCIWHAGNIPYGSPVR